MEAKYLDMVLVPLGLAALSAYHVWLLISIIRHPERTVIGINSLARRRWVRAMMEDPMKNGVLAVQTLRNNLMASTVLATTAITLTSLISVFAGVTTATSSTHFVYGNQTPLTFSLKFFAISLSFFLAFLCHVQSIRYYAHVSFLVTVVSSTRDGGVSPAYVARSLNRGSIFWSLGLRAFYVSFTLFLWIFGPIPMFTCCIVMSVMLYFLDFTTRDFHESFNGEEDYAAV